MPNMVTHDTFARELIARDFNLAGGSGDELYAFLLGNQGPDPLFCSVATYRFHGHHKLGRILHDYKPSELLLAFRKAVENLPEHDRPIGLAYANGFLCHYLLDSMVHPLVYHYEFTICSAGVPGLTMRNGGDVHGVIERKYDEMLLHSKRGLTVSDFKTWRRVLQGSEQLLDIVSRMYVDAAKSVYGEDIAQNMFRLCMHHYRRIQHLTYSPKGGKRAFFTVAAKIVRPYSFYAATSMRDIDSDVCEFDNREHAEWTNPFTLEESTDSFMDIFNRAEDKALRFIPLFDSSDFTYCDAREITGGIGFLGKPAEPF